MGDPVLSSEERIFLAASRRAVLATNARDGRPRLVPICFVVEQTRPILYSPLDDKPKVTDDARELARVRDLLRDPRVSILVDRWEEDWSALAWLRCHGTARLLEPDNAPEHAQASNALRAKYPQYASHRLESRPFIRIEIERATSWGPLSLP